MNDERTTGGSLPARPRRAETRFTFSRKVRVRQAGEGAFEEAHTVDVNPGGVQLEQRSRPEPGAALELRLPRPEGGELPLGGTVLWVKAAPQAGLWRVGVKFDLEPSARVALARYLAAANLAAARELGGGAEGPEEAPAPQPDGNERRAHPRVPARRQVMLRCADWVAYQRIHTVNISRGGMLVAMRSPPAAGSVLEVRLLLPGDEEVLLRGKAVRVEPPRPGTLSSRVGIALEPDPGTAERLARFLETAERELAQAPSVPGALSPLPHEPEPRGARPDEGPGEPAAAAAPPAEAPAEPSPRPILARTPAPLWTGPTRIPVDGSAPVLCADLGTSAIKAAVVLDGEVVVVEGEDGCTSIPAVVWLRRDGEVVVGEAARAGLLLDPGGTLHSMKPLLGHGTDEAVARRIGLAQTCAVYRAADGTLSFEVRGTELAAREVVAMILRRLRDLAQRQVERPVERCVLTLPHPFGAETQAALAGAAWAAELELLGLVPEPLATVLACPGDQSRERLVGVFDLGGGSFDFSVVAVAGEQAQLLASTSDHWLSGTQLDLLVAQYAAAEVLGTCEVDLRSRVAEWRLLVLAAEEAKRQLSSRPEAEVAALGIELEGSTLDVRARLTRECFESLTEDALRGVTKACDRTLRRAGLGREDLDRVVLAGAATRLGVVEALARSVFGAKTTVHADPELLPALGTAAAVGGAARGVPSAPHPPSKPETAGSIHGAGLAMADGRTVRLIEKAAPLPACGRQVLATSTDGQREVEVRVVLGTSDRTADNRPLGTCVLTGLPAGPAGSAEVEVLFEMREPGLLTVTARDLATGKRTKAHFELD